jgi:glutamate 5-kinase
MSNVRNMVVKVGTSVLTDENGQLDRNAINRIARQMAALNERGIKLTLVSSGAVGAGMGRAHLPKRPRSTPMLQATAAVGQPLLMSLYERALGRYGLHVGQVLVTRSDFEQRQRYVNINNTINSLHRLQAIPIINENDTIAVDELERFADNDTIAAMVTNLLKADLLVLLTVVDGLLDQGGNRVDLIPKVNREVYSLVTADRSALGSGGMTGKLNAAAMVTNAGEGVVIADGRKPNVLTRLLEGQRVGTIFAPADKKMSARRRWIAGAVRPAGTITVDAGAADAVRARGKSLLPRGITKIEGRFNRKSIVRIVDSGGNTVAHGLSNYNHADLKKIKGLKSSEIEKTLGQKPFDEVIHRDNLVLTAGED